MDRIMYERDFDRELSDQNISIKEPTKIEFEVPNDLNIYEFKTVCIRIAKSLGYSDIKISDTLGEIQESPEERDLQYKLFDEYNKIKTK